MNDAVREMLPEKRRIWILRYSRSKDSRASLKGLFVVVDSRRGLTAADEGLLAWALPEHRVHVLLSKADKLNHGEAAAVLRAAAAMLSGRATAQLFSALKGAGVVQAQDTLEAWLACPTGKGS